MTSLYTCKEHTDDYDFCPICEIERIEKAGAVAIEYWRLVDSKHERKLTAIVKWLEENQPDVFRRGLWEAINAA